jgi:two-component system chemotaxis response regulator CheY
MKKREPFALVVDDDPIQRQIIAAVLKKFGITCEVLQTSREFIQRLHSSDPDFCLIDLNIESLGVGFTIVEAVRKVLGPKPNLIVISGNADRNAVAHALELGANDFIIKPIDRDVLVSKLSRYVETKELLDARAPLLPVPDGGAQATVALSLSISSVDEFGLKLVASHLVSKGLALRLDGDFIQLLTSSDSVLLNVTSTWAEADGQYGAYAEFDRTDEKLMTSVRKYLAQKHPVAGKES